jgi:hypothetical protein
MGYASIVIFTLCLSYTMQLGLGYTTTFTKISDYFFGHYDPTANGGQGAFVGGNQSLYLAFGALVALSTILLSAIFPNPYLIFSGIFSGLLFLVTFPVELLTEAQLPMEIKMFGTSVFGVLYLLAWLFAYKGGSD